MKQQKLYTKIIDHVERDVKCLQTKLFTSKLNYITKLEKQHQSVMYVNYVSTCHPHIK